MKKYSASRRTFIKTAAAASAGIALFPHIRCSHGPASKAMKRVFSNFNFEVTTLGLGGQASLQWTPEDVNPVPIILKAFKMGVNYFDTSNLYGPSQSNFGKAFRQLKLIPGTPEYDESLRRSIWLTSKTHLRSARGEYPAEGQRSWTNGPQGSKTVDDLKRSLSLMFGDGKGNYPEGAYLDMILIHSVTSPLDVDTVYDGLYDTSPDLEHIGALAALRDYRDGTNLTGLNPRGEKLIRHVGFSGHYSPPVMMDMMQRDRDGLLEGLLVAVNSNDKLNFNMQHNVLPVASAKGMGLIGMKVFADGAMYSKDAEWSSEPRHVVRSVGSAGLPSDPLVKYTLTAPGMHTAIIGIGQISDDPARCQLTRNFNAAQIKPEDWSESDRNEVEQLTRPVKEGKTNYFQWEEHGLRPPQSPEASWERTGEGAFVNVTWHTAYAGNEPLSLYEVWRDGEKVGTVEHRPQIDKTPFKLKDQPEGLNTHAYKVVAVDAKGHKTESEEILVDPDGLSTT